MIEVVKSHPMDAGDRLDALRPVFEAVPPNDAQDLYDRLEPGAPTDDFAQYFKTHFRNSRDDALALLRQRIAKIPAPESERRTVAERRIEGEAVGENITEAARLLPFNPVTGAPLISFGQAMEGEGYLLNPRYWIVEYTLVKNDARRSFTASKDEPSALKQMFAYLANHEEWHNSLVEVNIKIGPYGAAAAIKDVWRAGSADKYAIDCLGAALLAQLRGIYLSYPAKERDAAFEKDYSSFTINRSLKELPRTSLEADMTVTLLPVPLRLGDQAALAQILQPGDQVPILNLYMSERTSPWRTENVIYEGNGRFFGHPLGSVTAREYARKIRDFIDHRYVDPKIGKAPPDDPVALEAFILEYSLVRSFSRPRAMTVPKATVHSAR
jgi:Protein-glutamine gamma-glutamyltransferase